MFGLTKRPSRDALYERIILEKDHQLRILVAEVDYLRATRGEPSLRAAINPSGLPDKLPMSQGDGGWVSEVEEAEQIVADLGLSAVHLPEILKGLGFGD